MSSFALEDQVLDSILDDYENAHTLVDQAISPDGKPLNKADVHRALISLTNSGLAKAYLYNRHNNQFVELSDSQVLDNLNHDETWFKASAMGRKPTYI